MLTARELALAGVAVTLVERGRTGQESSWAGGGILSPLYPWRYDDAVTQLASWSQARYEALSGALLQESGVDSEWTRSGMLLLDPGDAEAAMAWGARLGVAIERLAGDEAFAREPALGRAPPETLWMPDVAQVRNPRLVRALRGSLEHLGVHIREGTPVTGLILDGERARGVSLAEGPLYADAVVIAGGAWSGQLLGDIARLDVEPVRGQMLLFRTAPGTVRRILLQGGRYVIPRRDGHVLAGSTLEHVGYDKSVTEQARDDLWRAAVGLMPALAACPLQQHWSGLRPGSPAGIPYVGQVKGIKGLFANAGHFRNGVVLGPGSARLLADLLLQRPPAVDPAAYAIS